MALGTFVTSTMGMHSQSHALEQISANSANVNTVGYKKVETRFEKGRRQGFRRLGERRRHDNRENQRNWRVGIPRADDEARAVGAGR